MTRVISVPEDSLHQLDLCAAGMSAIAGVLPMLDALEAGRLTGEPAVVEKIRTDALNNIRRIVAAAVPALYDLPEGVPSEVQFITSPRIEGPYPHEEAQRSRRSSPLVDALDTLASRGHQVRLDSNVSERDK